jgi:hypothetical protein
MERRAFVKLSAWTALALTLPFSEGCSPKATEIDVAHPNVLGRSVDLNSIKEIGLAYRTSYKAEDNVQQLNQLLIGNISVDSFSEADLENKLEKQVEDDFRSGKTLVLKGWVLSVTEARQCALFTLIKS